MAFYNEFPGNRFYDGDLGWLMKRVKDLMDQGQTLEASIKALQEELDNLDLDAAVKRQLKKMLDDGALDAFINPYMLRGKKCVFFGDSIVWGDSADSSHSQVSRPFPEYIAEHSGCTAINAGHKSGTMATTEGTNNFANHIAAEASELSDADFVFVLYGINDYSQVVPIGSPDDTRTATFNGALNANLQTLRQYTDAEVIFISIPPCGAYWEGTGNTRYLNIRTYSEAVKAFCRKNGLKYIDLLSHSGMDASNWEEYTADRVHLKQSGYDLIGQAVLDCLGGCPTDAEAGTNVYNRLAIPNCDTYGHHRIIANGANRTNVSYTDWTFQPGLYRLKCKYTCSLTDAANVGFLIRAGSGNYLGSPLGMVCDGGVHEMVWYHRAGSEKSGELAIAAVVPDGVTIQDMDIWDLEIQPITGRVDYVKDYVLTPSAGEGSIKVTRHDNGSITVNGHLTGVTASAFATLASSPALRPLLYTTAGLQDTFYGVAATGNTAFARLQIAGPILSIASAVTDGSVNFSITY